MGSPVTTNILYGPVTLWKAPVGETVPADSVGAGVAWGGNWAKVGYTKAPLTMTYEDEQGEADVQEALTPVKRWKTKETVAFETVLAELTSEYLNLANGAGIVTTTAAGVGQVGKDEYEVGGESALDELAWGFEGTYVNSSGVSFPVRLFLFKATTKIGGETEFSKEEYPGISIQINALADMGKDMGKRLFKFQRVTAAAS